MPKTRDPAHAIDYGEAFLIDIEGEIERVAATLTAGAASDWSDYRHKCGQLAGLKYALDLFFELRRKEVEEN